MTCGIYCPNMAHGTCLPMPIVENKDNHKGEKRTLNMTVYGKKGSEKGIGGMYKC